MTTPRQASEFFGRTLAGYRWAKALMVGNKLGVFEHLEGEAKTPAQVAGILGVDQHSLTLLLRALAALGVLEVEGDRFVNASIASAYLVPGKPTYAGDNLRFQDMLWENWSRLEQVVRTGRPHKALPELLDDADPTFTRNYIRGMHYFSHHQAKAVAEILMEQPVEHLLDVGGGPAAYACAHLERGARNATVLDLEGTLEVARELTRDHPARDRLALVHGNYLEVSYGSGFDLVLMSHVTHDEGRAAVTDMFTRAFAALLPGGRIAIHDWVVDDETKTQPALNAAFSLNVLVYTNGGQVYSRSDYREMLEASGFVDVTSRFVLEDVVDNPTCLVVARKPTSPPASSR